VKSVLSGSWWARYGAGSATLPARPISAVRSFRRSGGIFAGNPLRLEIDARELDDAAAATLQRVLEGEELARLTQLTSHGVGADEYQYDLVVRRGEETISLRFDECTLPAELAPLVHVLEQRAQADA